MGILLYILRSVHCFYGLVGIPANVLLLIAILFERDTGLKTYSIILFNVAVTDLICIITDLITMTRIISRGLWAVYLFQVLGMHNSMKIFAFEGLCTGYGINFCFYSQDIMVHLFFHSILLIAVSFWYRRVILTGSHPSASVVQAIMTVALTPTFILLYVFDYVHPAEEQIPALNLLYEVHPEINASAISYTVIDLSDPHGYSSTIWVCIHPFVCYYFIISNRRQVLKKLASLAEMMSEKSLQMHQALVKALTYHAMLPSSLCIAIIFFELQTFDIARHAFFESTVFMTSTIPSVFNPILMLYYVKPYRMFYMKIVSKIFGIKEKKTTKASVSQSMTNASSNQRF